jgi:hypothetical protein
VPRELRELRSADRRSRGTGADARFLWRVTITARPVDQEDQLHQQQPRETGIVRIVAPRKPAQALTPAS